MLRFLFLIHLYMQKAVLITIGDEILSGNTVDTNSNFIAAQLKNIGIQVVQILTVSDEIETIKTALKNALLLGNIVFTTGGLGPTRDDRTKKALAEFFGDTLELDEATFQHLKQYLEKRGRTPILERNREQAFVPAKCTVFQNHNGTAPCMMMAENGQMVFSLPGVPFEVKPLVKNQIIPFLKQKLELYFITSRVVSVVGIPESILADKIESWEMALPKDMSLSYLPVGTRVKLKLTSAGDNEHAQLAALQKAVEDLLPILKENIIATDGDRIEQILGEILQQKKLRISVAESCTGGALANLIVSNPGSSQYFVGGMIAYEISQKINILRVSENTIAENTVVSEKVASEMALGCQHLFHTDISISTTGVAGPGTDNAGNSVGLVFYTIRIKNHEKTHRLFLPHLERVDFQNFVSQKILQDLVTALVENIGEISISP